MADNIAFDEVSLETALGTYTDALSDTASAMEVFVNATAASPYTAGVSAAANPLSSYMQGVALDYLSPLRDNLADIALALSASATIIQNQDSHIAHVLQGGA